MKEFKVDIDFYSMEITVKAKTKSEAKKKAKAKIVAKIKSHINHIYVDEA